MKIENWKEKAYLLEILGCIIYTFIIFLAMLFYTGGTADNPNIDGYSFWGNTISDSGRTTAYSGKSNTISMILLSTALILFAITTIPFFLALRYFFIEVKIEKKLSTIGSICGIIASISLVGIAFTPADILIGPHMIFVYIRYSSVFAMGVLFSLVMYMNNEFPRQYTYIIIIFTIVFFIISMMGLVGLALSRTTMVIGQKIGWFATLICFVIVGYGGWKLEKT